MAHLTVDRVGYRLPDGRHLLEDVSFKVAPGEHVALIGANGVGKTTTMRLLAGLEDPTDGAISVGETPAFMEQMAGSDPDLTVRKLYLDLAPQRLVAAAARLARTEAALGDGSTGDDAAMAYAEALAGWGELGGHELEVEWEAAADRAVGLPWSAVGDRPVSTFSGGEQKRLVLEFLFHSEHRVLLLDEPDNFLDVAGKQWLAEQLDRCDKTILFISHDRQLLADAAHKLVTIEAKGAWVHGGSFLGWADARDARKARIDDQHRRWLEERKRLVTHMRTMKQRAAISDANASRARAAETRLRHFDQEGPPPDRVKDQQVKVQLEGGRTGKQVVVADQLELVDLTFPFDLDLWFGDRVAVVGPNGTGKSHLLRLLAGDDVEHEGVWKLGARVVPGLFSQLHAHPEWAGRRPLNLLMERELSRGAAMAKLRRYELTDQAEVAWENLSGGQQARFQILLLEVDGANLLLLDEPTDNLDVASAEALETSLAAFEGTVLAVSHDRWFLRSFEHFLIFTDDAEVIEADRWEPAATTAPSS